MNVQELFKLYPPKKIAEAYLASEDWKPSFEYLRPDEKYALFCLRRRELCKAIKFMTSCEIKKTEEDKTLLLVEFRDDGYENENEKYFDVILVNTDEAVEKINCRMENNEPVGYAIDFCSYNEIAGYDVAESSVKKYGYINFIVAILGETTFFGYEPEKREDYTSKLIDDLGDIASKIKNGEEKTCPAEDVFKKIENETLERLEKDGDADAKEHYLAWSEYKNRTNDIEIRYMLKIKEENDEIRKQAYRDEFFIPSGEPNVCIAPEKPEKKKKIK